MDFTLFDTYVPIVTAFLIKALGVVLLLVGGWVVARWARGAVARGLQKTRLDVTLIKFFASITAWIILISTVLTALEIFGVQTTSFIAVLGAAGLAIGLAFQGTLSNFAAGVMLLAFRPFRVGDAVNIAGEIGKVDEIDLFMTKMDTFDNRRIVIPNSKIFGSTIETITFHPRRRVDVNVGVAYAADIDETRAVLEAALTATTETIPGALADPAPVVFLVEMAASSINWQVRVWAETPEFGNVKQATIRAVKKALDEAGLEIPFPQMDVHLDGPLEKAPA